MPWNWCGSSWPIAGPKRTNDISIVIENRIADRIVILSIVYKYGLCNRMSLTDLLFIKFKVQYFPDKKLEYQTAKVEVGYRCC